MTTDEFKDRQHHLSFATGLNQRIHQEKASYWAQWDRGFKIGVGVFAVAGVCLSVATFYSNSPVLDAVSIVVASLAAIAAIALNVVPIGQWESQHKAWCQQWTDLREEVDSLLFELSGENAPDELVRRLRELTAKQHRICGSEPFCKKKTLQRHHDDEEESRHTAEQNRIRLAKKSSVQPT